MENVDTDTMTVFSHHHIDYDDLLEHVIQGEHDLLYLDAYLREALTQ